ncbi:MAG: methyltransferase, partial [Pseudomonas sp.]|nr:methyltransferase [Pseudomonas sp.]
PQGYLVISDLVRVADRLAPAAEAFWQAAYPDLHSVDTRLAAIARMGYRTLSHFPLSAQAWANYLEPLRERVASLADEDFASQALADIRRELKIHENHLGEYGYHLFVMQTR